MQELEARREEFKYWFKKLRLSETGTWTLEDERDLQEEINRIEGHSVLSAWIICTTVFFLTASAIIILLKVTGII